MTDSTTPPNPLVGAAPAPRRQALAVTAVVVTRGATPYLAETLAAVAAQTRQASSVLVVDVADEADHDAVSRAVRLAFPAPHDPQVRALQLPRARTFGEAVQLAQSDATASRADGTETGPSGDGGWLWLLHDDSAPDPSALAALVRAVEGSPSVAIAGAKQRTWAEPSRLLEVGLRTSRSGRRMTGVEDGEVDQGQHDGRDDVLGVGLAGALVRRDVWDRLGGTDPALGPFGDGFDLSRRARLAGHRVIVVPEAVVRHAQAGYQGLRGSEPGHPPDAADPRRSFAARRRSLLHQRLVAAPLPLVPVVAVLAVVAGAVRSLLRVAAKEPGLAVAELLAPFAALARPRAIVRARARLRSTRRLPRRALRPLQADWREVWAEWRDRRLQRAETRKVVLAPSELELGELAQLTSRRRTALASLVALLAAATAVGLGPLISQAVSGAHLVGPALVPSTARIGELWAAATSGWVAGGLGGPGPADALLTALLPGSVLLGGASSNAVAVLVLGSVLLAGLGAWFAAGAATRSVGLRVWAALVWAAAPTLLLAVGDGRLGAIVVHVMLPWVALGLARAIGVQRVDSVVSGLVTARRKDDDPDGDVPGGHPDQPAARVGAAAPTGSIAAAAGAALAFAAVAAGAPSLLLPGVLALLVVAVCAPRARRRLLLVPVPALVLLGPLLAEVVSRGRAGVRLLVADPGPALDSTPADALHQLLGMPTSGAALVPAALPETVRSAGPAALGAVVLALAVLALLRGAPVARAVRASWVVAALGLATAGACGLVAVAAVDGTTVHVWPGGGVSLALAGLLAAGVVGADGLQSRLARSSFGWRQPTAVLVAIVAGVVPVAALGAWTWQARTADAVALGTIDRRIVPAVGQQAQAAPGSSRVLALDPTDDGVLTWQLLSGDGPQLVEVAAAVTTRTLDGSPAAPSVAPADPATTEVESVVARLGAGASGDVSADLAALAVADVLVPPSTSPAGDAARAQLVGRLDATAGLGRITENSSGIIWRVQPAAVSADVAPAEVVVTWARLVDDAPAPAVALAADARTVDTPIPAGTVGRLLVLAERADPGWRATLDGRALRSVAGGWRQTFEVGADGGQLVVEHRDSDRGPWLALQGVVALLTVLLAIPVRRRRAGRR